MKTQSEFYNYENGTNYFEQYFTTTSRLPINAVDYFLLKENLENAIQLLMDGKEIELRIIIKSE
jgi:hypothetical protein